MRRRAQQHPGPLWRLLSSASFRIALLFATLFLLAGLAFTGVLWWGTAGALERQIDAAIRADAVALAERWREAGDDAVADAIRERLALDAEDQTIYLLSGPDGSHLAGNLEALPEDFTPDQQWYVITLMRDDVPGEARLIVLRLPDNSYLAVGRDVAEKLRLRALLTEGLAWSAGVAILFAFAGAWLLRRSLEERLAPATATAAMIAGGDLSPRVPLAGREDEFEALGRSMNTMLDRIAHLMEGVRGVSDAIAHDLRTPIARARSRLEEALETSDDPATLKAALERGIADLDNVTRVFQAVLRIAEVEAGARRAAFAPLDLVPLLADAAELYGANAEEKGQTLRTSWPDRLPLTGDRDLLLQAVANLLDNAVKFTRPGGTISLSASLREDMVLLRITDEGPGLSAEDRDRVGERFFRTDSARATPGSGLGLSLVRAVVQLHGGTVWFEDGQGKIPGFPGLTVFLQLPVG
ncbi:HAMP domain-containing histidine kinase [Roseomonas marmotae]|uniref:histidine kinase n=2 Tax=Roseomonas marmotae TaxID=2768161 RepID=A0ABS3K9T0_9PROT|nr:HAMP domain-containing sensor histidine kinase [Roseomonas marmotae]MBO1074221.1 HAMP domain-containing histidine kinase [Roseomonas marmotae]QTI81022.1 HAMP domain-containing histidine kinase [Roseomonas marmotae]